LERLPPKPGLVITDAFEDMVREIRQAQTLHAGGERPQITFGDMTPVPNLAIAAAAAR